MLVYAACDETRNDAVVLRAHWLQSATSCLRAGLLASSIQPCRACRHAAGNMMRERRRASGRSQLALRTMIGARLGEFSEG